MNGKDYIFLTNREARTAVCMDLLRYEPQVLLFAEILRVISNGDAVIKRDSAKGGVWVGNSGYSKMDWLDPDELGGYICRALEIYKPDLRTMVAVCSRVFQTRAFQSENTETGTKGVCIETGMEDFSCRQCGNCCKSLDYHDAVTDEDIDVWEKARRHDILSHVGRFERADGETQYRIWLAPATSDLADICPFLVQLPDKKRWICKIHDVKPAICRNYPVSRKHGLMTGCPGFSKGEN